MITKSLIGHFLTPHLGEDSVNTQYSDGIGEFCFDMLTRLILHTRNCQTGTLVHAANTKCQVRSSPFG